MSSPRCQHTGLPRPFCAHCQHGNRFEDDPNSNIPRRPDPERVPSLGPSSPAMKVAAQDTRTRRWTRDAKPWGFNPALDNGAKVVMFARSAIKKAVERQLTETLNTPAYIPLEPDKMLWCWKCRGIRAHREGQCRTCDSKHRKRNLY